MHTLCNNTR